MYYIWGVSICTYIIIKKKFQNFPLLFLSPVYPPLLGLCWNLASVIPMLTTLGLNTTSADDPKFHLILFTFRLNYYYGTLIYIFWLNSLYSFFLLIPVCSRYRVLFFHFSFCRPIQAIICLYFLLCLWSLFWKSFISFCILPFWFFFTLPCTVFFVGIKHELWDASEKLRLLLEYQDRPEVSHPSQNSNIQVTYGIKLD